jgi:uncharacterized protein YbjT (DUF2867 family)
MTRVLVIEATGAQGGSVARHLLASGHFTVRALTRDPDSTSAQTLRSAGAEVVQGDAEDRASLRRALRGVESVFGVACVSERDGRHAMCGRTLVNAVAGAEVDHLVLSTLPGMREHMELEAYARSLELPITFVHVAIVAIEQLGRVVTPVFCDPAAHIGRRIWVAGHEHEIRSA